MTDSGSLGRQSPYLRSSALAPASQATGAGAVRPRNRHTNDDTLNDIPSHRTSSGGSFSGINSPLPRPGSSAASRASNALNKPSDGNDLGQFLGDSWAQSWASVQDIASTLLTTGSSQGKPSRRLQPSDRAAVQPNIWGPPPPTSNQALSDVATGSLAERNATLRAAKMASVLESHEGVNGGLDIAGKYKRRNSDESAPNKAEPEEYLVYIHEVQPDDTYAGLILRYRCKEDAFRRANGLWSRDSVQTRRWLTVPVDSCEIRGRPCDPPSFKESIEVDLLAPTPPTFDETQSNTHVAHDDYFGSSADNEPPIPKQAEDDNKPWTHVRWVQIDSFTTPVEIARVARQAMGYFPPRRKKSIITSSSFNTPRQSSDFSSGVPDSAERTSSRRQSSLSSQTRFAGSPLPSRTRVASDAVDNRPTWMRRPGGVGTMSRNVRTPGPENDYLNSWATKHLPSLNINDIPTMAVMESEGTHFGFTADASASVESHFQDRRGVASSYRQGSGLDRAAAAVETWLRGALARRPSSSVVSKRGRSVSSFTRAPIDNDGGDLIELADTVSDDGRVLHGPAASLLLASAPSLDVGGRASINGGEGQARGRRVGRRGNKKDE